MSTKTIPVTLNIDEQLEKDLIITAYEGGSTYWAELSEKTLKAIDKIVSRESGLAPSERFYSALQTGKGFEVNDCEDPSEVLGTISRTSMNKAWELLWEVQPETLGEIISGNWDASSADTFFQLATLGELVYG